LLPVRPSTARRLVCIADGHYVAGNGPGVLARAGKVDDDVNQTRADVVRLLEALNAGDRSALDQLFAILYDELKELARRQRRRWRGDYTLNTTALVHEAWVRLVGKDGADVESRAHFKALAARAMRHILCDYARRQGAKRRGGGLDRLTLDELKPHAPIGEFTGEQSDRLVALDEALSRLERIDARQSRVVECRFFGDLTVEETATAIGISPRTVKRDWAMAQAWLHREMTASR
jgi:RNA polymerase sigma factor (TIGR02999 family)